MIGLQPTAEEMIIDDDFGIDGGFNDDGHFDNDDDSFDGGYS